MRFARSLQWRLVFIFIAMTVCLTIPISFLLKKQIEYTYYDAFKNSIDNDGTREWKLQDNADIDMVMNDLDINGGRKGVLLFNINTVNKTYTVYDKRTHSFRSSDQRFYEDKNRFELEILSSENFVQAVAGKPSGNKRSLMRSNGDTFFDYALNKGPFIIYFRYYSGDWQSTIDTLNNAILKISFAAIIASLILGYILSKTITVPIINIMQKAQDIAEGNFGRVLEIRSDDEIGKLTRTFNFMSSELKNTLAEISSEKSKVETILNYMTDGVIAFNVKGEVMHANPAARRMLKVDDVHESFNEFSKKYDLGIALEDILYLELPSKREKSISVEEKYIRMYFGVFTDEEKKAEGVIAVLQDITEQQKLENMRKEFVANVSHELKTPLTSIKSYTETLLDGALDDRETAEQFLRVIDSEADRMSRLVRDLLQLSSIDNQQVKWNKKRFSFTSLVKNSIVKVQMESQSKEQTLETYVMGEIPEIEADRDRIEQVVLNILSNAIKYTPRGGKITVYVSRIYNDVSLKVVDTGIGIPQQDLPRIFERFYRVDKARSREMGGTGLGLSIAREITEAHGGTISVSSELGKGTEVTIKLPIDGKREASA